MNRGLRSGSGESVLSWVGWSIKLGGLVDNSLGSDGERSLTGVERSTRLVDAGIVNYETPSRWAPI